MKERTSLIAKRVQRLKPSAIRKYFENLPAGVITFGVGAPNIPVAESIRRECMATLERGETNYTSNAGLPELRDIISFTLRRDCGVYYDSASSILITTGVSEGLDLAFRSLVNPGEEVLIPEPCYGAFAADVILSDGEPIPIPVDKENNFRINPEEVEKKITDRTKVIVLNYPNNPVGVILDRKELEEICQIAIENDLVIISDEIYFDLVYDGKNPTCISSLSEMQERTVLLRGFSKGHAMTGMRIGYVAGPEEIISAMTKVHQYTMLCAPTIGQRGAIEALHNGIGDLKGMIREYDQRRKLLTNELNNLGLECFMPEGAFYAFPSIKSTGMTSEEFANKLLDEAKVAVVPGTAFGKAGEGSVRLSYAQTPENVILEGTERIEKFLSTI